MTRHDVACILTYIPYIDYASHNISFTTLDIDYTDEYTLMSICPDYRGISLSRGMATFLFVFLRVSFYTGTLLLMSIRTYANLCVVFRRVLSLLHDLTFHTFPHPVCFSCNFLKIFSRPHCLTTTPLFAFLLF
jgi:hypothetical protein